jgi:hypothetical protein
MPCPPAARQIWQSLDLKLYDVDNEEKRLHLLDTLERAQWIFVSSQRAWQSIPRVPQKWPLTTEYYRALFDGYLGFEPVKEWTNYPQLFGLSCATRKFEEALSVYDHPRVVLFRKTPEWSAPKPKRFSTPGWRLKRAMCRYAKSMTRAGVPSRRELCRNCLRRVADIRLRRPFICARLRFSL